MSRRRMMYKQERFSLDEHTKLLLHLDGNGKDYSMYNAIPSPIFDSFASGKFGQGADLSSAIRPQYPVNLSSAAGTIEFFIKITSQVMSDWMGAFGSFEHQTSGSGIAFRYTAYNQLGYQVYFRGENGSETSTGWLGLLNVGQWYHFAITWGVLSGTSFGCVYKDGSLLYSNEVLTNAPTIGISTLFFGQWATNSGVSHTAFPAIIDEFRVSNIRRYTDTNFTLPTVPFTD